MNMVDKIPAILPQTGIPEFDTRRAITWKEELDEIRDQIDAWKSQYCYTTNNNGEDIPCEETVIDLPKSNVITLYLEGGASLVIRPSGTEPKIKIYYTTVGATNEEAAALQKKYAEAFTKIVNG